jgi:hypothetical protein
VSYAAGAVGLLCPRKRTPLHNQVMSARLGANSGPSMDLPAPFQILEPQLAPNVLLLPGAGRIDQIFEDPAIIQEGRAQGGPWDGIRLWRAKPR